MSSLQHVAAHSRSYSKRFPGSFGSIPRAIQSYQEALRARMEARPDPFLRYEFTPELDKCRAAVAALLNVPIDTCVFVPNATTGVNTVLRNLTWGQTPHPSGEGYVTDEILFFSTIYPACGRTAAYIVDSLAATVAPGAPLRVTSRKIDLSYPLSNEAIVSALRAAVAASRAAGRNPKVCVLDVVSSAPGVRFPFESVVAACRELGVLSLIDGAQGIGMVDIDLSATDPDFFVSNCHKWLFVPRGCAVFYVPSRNQDLMTSTLPTSHGYHPRPDLALDNGGFDSADTHFPPRAKSHFVTNFEFTGTLDSTAYLCVAESIRWRRDVLGGEERIRRYLWDLNKRGAARVADILGTEVLDNEDGTMTNCAMANIALPLWVGDVDAVKEVEGKVTVPRAHAFTATNWMQETIVTSHDSFVPVFVMGGRWWCRLSAQVYLDMDDYEATGEILKHICARVARGEYKSHDKQ